MGWTASEDLVLIYDDGTMVVYTVHGVMKFQRLLARVGTFLSSFVFMFLIYVM